MVMEQLERVLCERLVHGQAEQLDMYLPPPPIALQKGEAAPLQVDVTPALLERASEALIQHWTHVVQTVRRWCVSTVLCASFLLSQ